MAAPLTGLGSKPMIHGLPPCACGCGRGAERGFPGDVHYATTCVPPTMRFPWEAGYVAPAEAAAPLAAHTVVAPAADLFPGFQPG